MAGNGAGAASATQNASDGPAVPAATWQSFFQVLSPRGRAPLAAAAAICSKFALFDGAAVTMNRKISDTSA